MSEEQELRDRLEKLQRLKALRADLADAQGPIIDVDDYTVSDAAADLTRKNINTPVMTGGPMGSLPLGLTKRLKTMAAGVTQGMTADFGDEAWSVARGYDTNPSFAAAFDENPVSFSAGYLGGAAAGAPGRVYDVGARAGAHMAKGAPALLSRMAQGSAGGALAGAVQGAGFSPDDRAGGAGRGGAAGAALGGGLPVATAAVRNVAAPIYRVLRQVPGLGEALPAPPGERKRALAALGRAIEMDEVKPSELEASARAINRRRGMTTPKGEGSVAVAATRGRSDAATLTDALADTNAETALGMLRDHASRAGPGRRLVVRNADRYRGQSADMLRKQLDRLNAGPRGSASAVRADIRANQLAVGEPAYQAAVGQPIRRTQSLAAIEARPSVQRALEAIAARVRETGDDALARFIGMGDDGLLTVADDAPTEVWQKVLQQLDNEAYTTTAARRIGQSTASTADVNAVRGTRGQVYRDVADQNPQFAAANAAWSADEVALDAVEHTRKILNPGPGRHREWLEVAQRGAYRGQKPAAAWFDEEGRALPHAFDAARRVAREVLDENASKNGPSFAATLRRDRNLMDRLRFVFGDEIDDVLAGVEDVARGGQVRNYISPKTGSQTQPRMADAAFNEGVMADATVDAMATGNPLAPAMAIVRKIMHLGKAPTPQESHEVLRVAMSPYTPSQVRNLLLEALKTSQARERMIHTTPHAVGQAGLFSAAASSEGAPPQ